MHGDEKLIIYFTWPDCWDLTHAVLITIQKGVLFSKANLFNLNVSSQFYLDETHKGVD